MPFQVILTPSAEADLDYFKRFEQRVIVDAARRYLRNDADVESQHRKKLRANPVAPWELRFGNCRENETGFNTPPNIFNDLTGQARGFCRRFHGNSQEKEKRPGSINSKRPANRGCGASASTPPPRSKPSTPPVPATTGPPAAA